MILAWHLVGLGAVSARSYKVYVHKHLRRLERVWIETPIYFVTTCTRHRKPVLGCDDVAKILIDEWRAAHSRHSWAVGRYVIMPDHVHFFCKAELNAKPLSEFVGFWKSYTSRKIHAISEPRALTAVASYAESKITRSICV